MYNRRGQHQAFVPTLCVALTALSECPSVELSLPLKYIETSIWLQQILFQLILIGIINGFKVGGRQILLFLNSDNVVFCNLQNLNSLLLHFIHLLLNIQMFYHPHHFQYILSWNPSLLLLLIMLIQRWNCKTQKISIRPDLIIPV